MRIPPLVEAELPLTDASVATARRVFDKRLMFTAIWLGGPALVGGLSAMLAGFRWRRVRLLIAVGLVLALGLVLVVYLRAPIDYAHDRSGCSDCVEYLGRWWEPALVVFIAVVGYVFWSLGIAVGLLLRTSAGLLANRSKQRASGGSTHLG